MLKCKAEALKMKWLHVSQSAKSKQQGQVRQLGTWQKQKIQALFYAGRVKTLHPGVHGGILAKRDDASHMDALHKHKLSLIDVV